MIEALAGASSIGKRDGAKQSRLHPSIPPICPAAAAVRSFPHRQQRSTKGHQISQLTSPHDRVISLSWRSHQNQFQHKLRRHHRLNSKETKIAPRSERIVVDASGRSAVIGMVGSRGRVSNRTLPEILNSGGKTKRASASRGTLTRVWAERGSRPPAPRDQRREWAYIFGAVCPCRDIGAALVLPYANARAMSRLAGAGGFEPPHGGIKIRCLTAWRRSLPNIVGQRQNNVV